MTAWALHTGIDIDAVNVHLGALQDAGLLGIVEEAGRAVVYLSRRSDDLPLAGRWEPVPERDWNAESRRYLRPVTVGGITVLPPWEQAPPDAGVRVVVDPGQAFGTGQHETTTGCLAALQELDLHGKRVLDVGTGSGVLALAAALLGAAEVVAVDVDPLAVEATAGNAAANAVTLDVRLGSADAVAGRFDVVVANLDTPTIQAVAEHLAARLAPDGTLVVSGVSIPRGHEAITALEAHGLVAWSRPGAEWLVIVGRHRR